MPIYGTNSDGEVVITGTQQLQKNNADAKKPSHEAASVVAALPTERPNSGNDVARKLADLAGKGNPALDKLLPTGSKKYHEFTTSRGDKRFVIRNENGQVKAMREDPANANAGYEKATAQETRELLQLVGLGQD